MTGVCPGFSLSVTCWRMLMACFTIATVAAFSEKRGRRAFSDRGFVGLAVRDAWNAPQEMYSSFSKHVLMNQFNTKLNPSFFSCFFNFQNIVNFMGNGILWHGILWHTKLTCVTRDRRYNCIVIRKGMLTWLTWINNNWISGNSTVWCSGKLKNANSTSMKGPHRSGGRRIIVKIVKSSHGK